MKKLRYIGNTSLVLEKFSDFDKDSQLIIKKGPSLKSLANVSTIPASVPSWKQQYNRAEPMFPITWVLNPDNLITNWNTSKTMIAHLPPQFKEIELAVLWSLFEPLPGVYDFNQLTRIIKYAQKKGISVYFWVQFEGGAAPEWVPSVFMQGTKNGESFYPAFVGGYTFHGGWLDYFAQPIKNDILSMSAHLAVSLRAYPSFHGYFYPAEESYYRLPGGYEPQTIASFRRYCQKKWKTIAYINKRWQTHFTEWSQINHPSKNSSKQYIVDFKHFYFFRLPTFHKKIIETMRKYDPRRIFFVEGFPYSDAFKIWLAKHGCAIANGGAQDPGLGPWMIDNAMDGLKNRSESVSLFWTDYPYRLDDTVFTASLAGGDNIIGIRTYLSLPANNDFSLWEKLPIGLDRVIKFMPILKKLNQTKAMPFDAFFLDTNNLGEDSVWSTPGTIGSWDMDNMAQSGINCGIGPWEKLLKSKIVFAFAEGMETEFLKQKIIDRLIKYVKNGGILVMYATTGRKCLEHPLEDWVLLHDFGFIPPNGNLIYYYRKAVPVSGSIFPASAKSFELYTYGHAVSQPSDVKTIAYINNDKTWPAISWKKFGKGKVMVIWANGIIPMTVTESGGRQSYPFLRDIARWAGVPIYTESSNPWFWAYLLKKKQGTTYYGMVGRLMWGDNTNNPDTSIIKFPLIPNGNYHITELISGKDIGQMSGTQLQTQGINVQLVSQQVAIYQIKKVD